MNWYCVTILMKKPTGFWRLGLKLGSGLIQARSAEEALGIAVAGMDVAKDEYAILLKTVVNCDPEQGVKFFESEKTDSE